MDSDRFTRPVPCVYCGGIFNHYSDCPRFIGPVNEENFTIEFKPKYTVEMSMIRSKTFDKIMDTLEELTEKNYFTIQEPRNVFYKCLYCDEHWEKGHKEKHDYDCPISMGRQLLEELK